MYLEYLLTAKEIFVFKLEKLKIRKTFSNLTAVLLSTSLNSCKYILFT